MVAYTTPRRSRKLPHVCATCGTPYVAGGDSRFCTQQCFDQYERQKTRRLRCYRCNQPPRLYTWVRVSPDQEAPLCGTDECVIAWHPRGGWPEPTTRPLKKERFLAPTLRLGLPPRADALTSEAVLLARNGRLRATAEALPLVEAAINLLAETATSGLPSNPYRQVPAFRIIDLARALRMLLGDLVEGSLDHHLLTCATCLSSDTNRRRLCKTAEQMYAAELGLLLPAPG